MAPTTQITRATKIRPVTTTTPARKITRADPRVPAGPAHVRRTGHEPLPWVPDLFVALAGLGFGVTVALVITGETRGSLAAPGGWLIAGGRLAGFTGAYLMLVMVVSSPDCLGWSARSARIGSSVGTAGIGPWVSWAHHRPCGAHHPRLRPTGQSGSAPPAVGVPHVVSGPSRRRRRLLSSWSWSVSPPSRSPVDGSSTRPGGSSISTHTSPWLSRSPTRSSPGARSSVTRSLGRLDRALDLDCRVVILFRVVAADRSEPPTPATGIRGQRRGAGRVLGHLLRPSARSPRRLGRSVLPVALFTKELWWHAHPYSLSALPRPPYLRSDGQGTR
jgi:hypothetical protein